jgi:hypothetical protein
LFIALFQILRDRLLFERELLKQTREHAFVAALTSHMSQVVFAKHVEFAENYIKTWQDKVLKKLLEEGPAGGTRFGLDYTQDLYDVRKKYILWISPSMTIKLEQFENTLQDMGARAELAERSGHSEYFNHANKLYMEILGIKDQDDPELNKKKRSYQNLIINHLQQILNIEKLTNLRDSIISDSYKGTC